jgi:hypothetical protein
MHLKNLVIQTLRIQGNEKLFTHERFNTYYRKANKPGANLVYLAYAICEMIVINHSDEC